ncbi:TPA: cell surface protein, partial [Streptococcus suis]|nr:cell surface protein [Streptococcus suis]
MSKQKVVSSLLLSTVVLGGLAFYSTTTVKAESLETDVTSVSSGDVVEKPVISNEEGGDFLAEEELEDDETLEEELNEQAEEVTEPSLLESIPQPRAVMGDSGNNNMGEISVDDEFSDYTEEKVTGKQEELIQSSNADYWNGSNQEKLKKSVSINLERVEEGEIIWEASFDTSAWAFNHHQGGLYFILPEGLELTRIIDNSHYDVSDIISRFPKKVNLPENNGGQKYRFFSKEQSLEGDNGFNSQWNWSAGQAPNETISRWKSENRFSEIYFIDQIRDTGRLSYIFIAKIKNKTQTTFPLVAVMKSFKYGNSKNTEVTSLGARMITLETPKETPMPPKEAPKTEPEAPKPEAPTPDAPKQDAPETPDKQPEGMPKVPEAPKEAPKKEDTPAPDAPQPESPKDTPEASPKLEAPQVPEVPKQDAPKEEPKESPKQEMPEAPQEPKEQPKDTPEVSPKPEAPQTPPAPSTPEEKPQVPEEPKQEDVQP